MSLARAAGRRLRLRLDPRGPRPRADHLKVDRPPAPRGGLDAHRHVRRVRERSGPRRARIERRRAAASSAPRARSAPCPVPPPSGAASSPQAGDGAADASSTCGGTASNCTSRPCGSRFTVTMPEITIGGLVVRHRADAADHFEILRALPVPEHDARRLALRQLRLVDLRRLVGAHPAARSRRSSTRTPDRQAVPCTRRIEPAPVLSARAPRAADRTASAPAD